MPIPPTETGFSVDLSALLRSGVQLNRFDAGIQFWKDVDGLQFTESSVKRKPGRDFIVDVGSTPVRGLVTNNEYGTKVIYAGDLGNLYSYRLDTTTVETVGSGYNLLEASGASIWDSGAATWDSGASVWDEGILQANAWSFTTFGSWVIAASGEGPLKIKKNNVTFADMTTDAVTGVTITAGGTNYSVDDTITFTTSGSGTGLTATVTEETGNVVTAIKVTAWGSGFVDGESLTQATTSGSGTGFTGDVVTTDAPFTRADVVAKLGPHILVVNYDKSGNELPFDFGWCSADNPDEWLATTTNSAGSLTVREATTALTSIAPLGDGLALYTEDQMFLVSYTGAPFYFGYRRVMGSGVGAVSSRSTITVDRHNYGLSRRGIFVTDGSTVQQLGVEQGIDEYIRENIATSEYPQVAGYHNSVDNEVVWVLPIANTRPTQEIYYNYKTNTFGTRTTSLTAFQQLGLFDKPISADNEGNLYYEGTGLSAQSTSGTTRAHDLDDPDHIKELTAIRVGKRGSGNPVIRLGWSDTIGGTVTYVDSFTVMDDYEEHFLRTAGRYLYLNVTSNSPSDAWELTHMTVQGRTGGTR